MPNDENKGLKLRVRAQLKKMNDEQLDEFIQDNFDDLSKKLHERAAYDEKINTLIRKEKLEDIARALGPEFAKEVRLGNELVVLLLSPPNTVAADGPAHVSAIKRAFENVRDGLYVRIRESVAGTLAQIGASFEENTPRAVHIVTHGNEESIMINDGNNRPVPLDAASLIARFRLALPTERRATAKLDFVTLGACHSDVFVQKLVPDMAWCGIGLSGLISPESAQCFYDHFYRALAKGRNVADAFAIARLELHTKYDLGNRPHLVDPDGKASTIYFPQQNPGTFLGPKLAPVGFVAYLGTVSTVLWWLLDRFV